MKRMLLTGCLFASMLAASAHGQENRRPESAGQAFPGVGLGKPVGGRSALPAETSPPLRNLPPSLSETFLRTSYQPMPPTPAAGPALARPVSAPVQGRTSYAPPGSPEEQFNCGVVSEGPPSGHPMLGGPGRWFNDNLGGSWCQKLGITWQPDHRFDRFSSPVSNPFFFEDPRALTEVRPIAIYQKIPGDTLYNGGNAQFYGLQARLALNEHFSIVMPKLGYVRIQSDGLAPDGSGLSEIMIGPKWTFLTNDSSRTLAALGMNFEIPVGSDNAGQSTGDGGFTPYLSFGQEFFQDAHFLATTGYRWGFNNDRADMFFLSAHVDYGFFGRLYPLVELNWYYYTSNGNQTFADYDGRDLLMLGSTDVSGRNVLTLALGLRAKIIEDRFQVGAVYEFPLTSNKDMIDYRITFDLIFRY